MTASVAPAVSVDQLGWVSALIFGFPILMVLLGEVIRHLQRRRHPFLAAVRILRNWVIPFLALDVLLAQVMNLSRTTVLVRSAETLLWISLIYGALTLLNSILFEGAPQGSWQAKVPQLFRDLSRFILVLVGCSIVLSTVWGADLGGFLTALGVGSLVLGLALQDSLGNIFSGVALLFEQPIRLGDWVEVNGKEGKVVEVNWRAVHLLTGEDDLVVVPNSELGKTSFTNMSRPMEGYIKTLPVNFGLGDPPNRVKEVLRRTAAEIPGVLSEPAPSAELVSINDGTISYVVKFACADFGTSGDLADAFLCRLWYVVRRQGLTLPSLEYPTSPPPDLREELLHGLRNSCFAVLPQADLERLATVALVQEYAAEEVVLLAGTPLTSLRLILEGEAEILTVSSQGTTLTVGILSPGECFGEQVILLHHRVADTTVRAGSDLRVLVIDASHLEGLIDGQPRLRKDLAGVIEIRRRALEALEHEAGVGGRHA